MKIGALARQTGTSVDTLRFYEEKGLLAPPRRTESGYRIYPPEAVSHVKFIKQAQALGFSLQELLDFMPALTQGRMRLVELQQRIHVKIESIDAKILQLQSLRTEVLQTLQMLGCDPDTTLDPRTLNKPSQ